MGFMDLLKPKKGDASVPPRGNLATQSAVPPNAVEEPLIPPLPSNLKQPEMPPLPKDLGNELPPMPNIPKPGEEDTSSDIPTMPSVPKPTASEEEYQGPQFPEMPDEPEMPPLPGAEEEKGADEEMPEMPSLPQTGEEPAGNAPTYYKPVTEEEEVVPEPVTSPVSHKDDLDVPPTPAFEGEEDVGFAVKKSAEHVPDKLPPLDLEEVPSEPYIKGMSEAYEEVPQELRKEAEEQKELHAPTYKTPESLFVKANEYDECLSETDEVRILSEECERVFSELNSIKNTKDSAFEKFKKTLEDLERKFVFIDKTVFEG